MEIILKEDIEMCIRDSSLTEDEMREGIRKGLASRGMFPVFCVCAGKDMGVRRLMEFLGNVVPVSYTHLIVDLLPEGLRVVPERLQHADHHPRGEACLLYTSRCV